MRRYTRNFLTDLRGASELTVDALTGVVDIVESLHYAIGRSAGLFETAEQTRTKGITGLVYRNVRLATNLVGAGTDLVLEPLSLLLGDQTSPPAREAVLAAINGVLGDHLRANDNPLAIPMQFRRDGEPLSDQDLVHALQQSDGRVVIMVHGACLNDLQWRRRGHDHGSALAQDFGILPLYLHYNSGLHVSENGRLLSNLLQRVVEQAPQPLELAMIGYSMGGLVARSACQYGRSMGQSWLNDLQQMIFLGTPHHGAPLEKGGTWINMMMDISPYNAPFSRLSKFRSAGLTDLRYGNVDEADWRGRDRFEVGVDERTAVPLPDGVACYAIAASTSRDASKPGNDLLGDGLVPVSSALGKHKNAELDLGIPESRQWIGHKMNHLDLLNQPQLYDKMKQWLDSGGQSHSRK